MPATTEVQRRPGRGRCLIAAQDLNIGDLVFETEPLCAVLEEDQVRERCARCFGLLTDESGVTKRSRCAKCKSIWYCSRDCQKLDWAEHRLECKAWSEPAGERARRVPTRTLRMAGRIVHLMNRSPSHMDSDTTPSPEQVRRDIAELVDHNDKRTKKKQKEFGMMATYVASMCASGGGKGCYEWPSTNGQGFVGLVETVYRLLGKLACNVFSITHGLGTGVVGCGLYIDASAANHSCMPNVVQTFAMHGRSLSLRCIRPIQRGEEIMLGISDLTRPRAIRRQRLRESYFFHCECERCDSKYAELEDSRMEGYACPDRNCTGLCERRSAEPTAEGDVGKCGIEEESVASYNEEGKDSASRAGNGRNSKSNGEADQKEDGKASPSQTSRKKKKEQKKSERRSDDAGGISIAEEPLSVSGNGKHGSNGLDAKSSYRRDIMTCDTCGATRDAEEVEREGKAILDLLRESQRIAGERVDFMRALSGMQEALVRAIPCLYCGNWIIAELYSGLVSVALDLEMLEAGLHYATEGIDKQRLCWSAILPYSPMWANQMAITGKLLLWRGLPSEAVPYLEEAASAIEVMFGLEHRSHRNAREMLAQAYAGSGR